MPDIAIAWTQISPSAGGNANTFIIPGSAVAGQIAVAALYFEESGTTQVTVNPLAGWAISAGLENTVSTPDIWFFHAWKRLTAGDIGATVSFVSNGSWKMGSMVGIDNAARSGSPYDATPTSAITAGTPSALTVPDITPVSQPHLELVLAVNFSDSSEVTAPAGMSEAVEEGSCAIFYLRRTTTTPPGARQFTYTGAHEALGFHLLIKEEPPPPAPGQTAAPTSDTSVGTWTTDTGATTNLYAAIDEASPGSDADYVRSVAGPSNAVYEAALASVTDPNSGTGHTVSVRALIDSAGPAATLVTELRQGASALSTPASWSDTLTTTAQRFDHVLSAAQANAITDYAALRLRFTANQPPSGGTVPTFVGFGTEQAVTTAAMTVPWPGTIAVGDIGLLFVERAGGSATPTLTTPAGFAQVTGALQSTGTTTAGTKMCVFWCRATSTSMASPVVAASADHQYGAILTFRDCIAAGDPWDAVGGGVKAASSTAVTLPGVTTTVDNTLIVHAAARDNDTNNAIFSATTPTNAALTGITKVYDDGTNVGLGGGFAVVVGGKATAGATGNTTTTMTAGINAYVTIALKPTALVAATSRARVTWASLGVPSLATAYETAVLTDAPAAYWKLNEVSGAVAADSSGNGRDGTYSGTAGGHAYAQPSGVIASTAHGVTNTALNASGPWIDCGFPTIFNSPANFTLEAWVYVASEGTPVAGTTIIGCHNNGNAGYGLLVGATGNGWWKSNIRVVDAQWFDCLTQLSTNAWHHIVCTYDGTTYRMYSDGVPDGEVTATNGPGTASAGNPFMIAGAAPGWGGPAGFNGIVDEAAFYTTVLSPTRIAAHYAAGTGSTGPVTVTPTPVSAAASRTAPVVVGGLNGFAAYALSLSPTLYWRLGEAAGAAVAADSSGNGRDGAYNDFAGTRASLTYGASGGLTGDTDTTVGFPDLDGWAERANASSAIANQPEISLMALVWLASGTHDWSGLCGFRYWNGTTEAEGFYFQREGSTNNLQVHFAGNAGNHLSTQTALTTDAWHLVVGTYRRYSGELLLYVDGKPVGLATQTPNAANLITNAGVAFHVNRLPYQHNGTGAPGAWTFGRLSRVDEVALFPVALDGKHVRDLWDRMKQTLRTEVDLARLSSGRWIGGATLGNSSGIGVSTDLETLETKAARPLHTTSFYKGWADPDNWFPARECDNSYARNMLPMVSWEPWNFANGVTQPTYALSTIISGAHDAYIDKWGAEAARYGRPIMVRFAHEMNGWWYPWNEGVNGNTAGQFVQAWQRVWTRVRAAGGTNVVWCWCPNVDDSNPSSGMSTMSGTYPGDAYVDWLGLDGYNWGTDVPVEHPWETPAEVFAASYTRIVALAPTKPLLIGETAASENGGSKPAWITELFQTYIPASMPKTLGVVWFDLNKERDWRIDSTTPTQTAFRTAVADGSPYYTLTPAGVTPAPVSAGAALVAPTVVRGGLSIVPVAAGSGAALVAPTVVRGGLSLTVAPAGTATTLVAPTVTIGGGAVTLPYVDEFTGAPSGSATITDTASIIDMVGNRLFFSNGGADNWTDHHYTIGPFSRSTLGAWAALIRVTNYTTTNGGLLVSLSPSASDPTASGGGAVNTSNQGTGNYQLWSLGQRVDGGHTTTSIDYLFGVAPRAGGGWFTFASGGRYGAFPAATLLGVSETQADATLYAHIAAKQAAFYADYVKALPISDLPTAMQTRYGLALAADTFDRGSLGTTAEFSGLPYTVIGSPSISSNRLSASNYEGVSVNPGVRTRVIKCRLVTGSGAGEIALIFRGDGTQGSGVAFYLNGSLCGLYRQSDGNPFDQTGAYHLDASTTHELEVRDTGTAIEALLDGQTVAQATTTLDNTQTSVGFYLVPDCTVDQFSLWPEAITLTGAFGTFPAVPVGQGAALAGDAFTNIDGTPLTTHNPAWQTTGTGAWEVRSGEARMTTPGVSGIAHWDTGTVDHEASSVLRNPTTTPSYPNDWFNAVYARYVDGSHYIEARKLRQDTSNEIEVWEDTGSGKQLIGYVNLGDYYTPGGTNLVKLAVKGAEAAAYLDGEVVVQCTVTGTSGTRVGIGVNDSLPNGQPSWDDFEIRTAGVAPLLVSPAPVSSAAAVIVPTVVRGPIALTPAAVESKVDSQGGIVVRGSLTLTSAPASAPTALVAPTVVRGSVSTTVSPAAAASSLVAPTTVRGSVVYAVTPVVSPAAVVAPSVVRGGIISTPAPAAAPTGVVAPAVSIVTPVSYTTAVLVDLPLGYWKLGESAGTVAADSSGHSAAGTYVGAPTLGQPGGVTGDTAAAFNGSSQWVTIASNSWLNTHAGAFTVEAWIKTDGVVNDDGCIYDSMETTAGTGGFRFELLNGKLYATIGRPGYFTTSVVGNEVAFGGTILEDNEWHHVAATYDGVNEFLLYIDGRGDGGVEVGVYNTTAWSGNRYIGHQNEYPTTYNFAGLIDEVAVYGTALSPQRIADHYGASGGPVIIIPYAVSARAQRVAPIVTIASPPLLPVPAAAAAALVTPTVVRGPLSITPALVGGAAATVAPSVVRETITYAPASSVARAVGLDPTMGAVGGIGGGAISSVAAVVAPTVVRGSVVHAPALVSAAASRVAPTVLVSTNPLTPLPAAAATALAPPLIVGGPVVLTPPTVTGSAALAGPTVVRGSVLVLPVTVSGSAARTGPTVVANVLLLPSFVTGSAALVAPTVVRESVVYAPPIAAGRAQLVAPAIVQSSVVYAPPPASAATARLQGLIDVGTLFVYNPQVLARTQLVAPGVFFSSVAYAPAGATTRVETLNASVRYGSITLSVAPVLARSTALPGTLQIGAIVAQPAAVAARGTLVAPTVRYGSVAALAGTVGAAAQTIGAVASMGSVVVVPSTAAARTQLGYVVIYQFLAGYMLVVETGPLMSVVESGPHMDADESAPLMAVVETHA